MAAVLGRRLHLDGLVLASFPGPPAGEGFAPFARRFARAIEAEGLDAAGERFVWGPASGLDRRAAHLVRLGFLEHAPHALAHILREVVAGLPAVAALAPELRELRVPVLVVAGERDAASVAAGRALAEALPRARSCVIENAGHLVNLERPRAFNAALRDFLAVVYERPAG